MAEQPYYLQVGYRGASIALHIVGNVTPETLRYISRFALFQADTMEKHPSPGETKYASWFPIRSAYDAMLDRHAGGHCHVCGALAPSHAPDCPDGVQGTFESQRKEARDGLGN